VIDLGLTAAEFWQFTPRHISLLFERFKARERRLALIPAVHAAWYINVHRDSQKSPSPVRYEDLMPFPAENTYTQNNGQQGMSTEAQISYLRAWAHASGAIVRKRGTV